MSILNDISNLLFPNPTEVKVPPKSSGNSYVRSSERICPYCKVKLVNEVKAKTKCKNCGEFIYRRTDPSTNEVIAVTREQADVVELEWAKLNGNYEELVKRKEEFRSMKSNLSQRFGKVASDNDVQWALQNERLAKAMQRGDWDEMSGCYLQMGVICFKEKKYKQCIINYSLCGNCATRAFYRERRKLGLEVDEKYLKNYHFLDTTPVRDSLLKLGHESDLERLISIVQNMKLQPSEVVTQVEAILNV